MKEHISLFNSTSDFTSCLHEALVNMMPHTMTSTNLFILAQSFPETDLLSGFGSTNTISHHLDISSKYLGTNSLDTKRTSWRSGIVSNYHFPVWYWKIPHNHITRGHLLGWHLVATCGA